MTASSLRSRDTTFLPSGVASSGATATDLHAYACPVERSSAWRTRPYEPRPSVRPGLYRKRTSCGMYRGRGGGGVMIHKHICHTFDTETFDRIPHAEPRRARLRHSSEHADELGVRGVLQGGSAAVGGEVRHLRGKDNVI